MKDYKLLQKAYEVDFGKIEDGYVASEYICHADSINSARKILLGKLDGYWLLHGKTEITYLNIPVKRCPECDLFEFEGNPVSLHEIKEIIAERERIASLDAILNNPLNHHSIR